MRTYNGKSNEAGTEMLVVSWTAGATGAVGALNPATRGKGFAATFAVRTGTGAYDVFLKDKALDLIAYVINANGPTSATAGKVGQVISDVPGAAAPKVSFVFVNAGAGAPADPANGDQIYVTLWVKRRSPL